MKTRDQNYAIGKPYAQYGRTYKSADGKETGWEFNFITGHGVCEVLHSWDDYEEIEALLDLSFYYSGRLWSRVIRGKKYTRIGCARKAGEFVKEIVKKVSQ